jgi:hypothetical protein
MEVVLALFGRCLHVNDGLPPDPSKLTYKPITELQRRSMNFCAGDSITEPYPIIPVSPKQSLRQHRISHQLRNVACEPNSPRFIFECTFRDAKRLVRTRYIWIPSVGPLVYRSASADSLTASGHSWSNLVIAGYPLNANDDAAVPGLIHIRNVVNSRLFFIQCSMPVQSTMA